MPGVTNEICEAPRSGYLLYWLKLLKDTTFELNNVKLLVRCLIKSSNILGVTEEKIGIFSLSGKKNPRLCTV